MKLSAKAQAAMDSVVKTFKSGDLSPITMIACMRLPDDAPAKKWSFNNRVLAFAQTGTLDCRGYKQWKKVGRQVCKGEDGAFIITPYVRYEKNKRTGDKEPVIRGFGATAVFAYHQTDGDADCALTYEPKDPPPLMDVAEALGLEVHYEPGIAAGMTDGKTVWMSSYEPEVFFHELAHAAHRKADGGEVVGEKAYRETVAELSAAVLAEMYGYDLTGNAWQYIEYFAPEDPLKAIREALKTVETVLEVIETAGDALE
jgi:hypothetical protein